MHLFAAVLGNAVGLAQAKSHTCTRKPERISGTMLYTFKVFLIE